MTVLGKRGCFSVIVFMLFLLLSGLAVAEITFYAVPRLTSDFFYDDNIYFANKDAISDFVSRIGPGVKVAMSTDNLDLDIDYELQQVFYYHQSARNSLNHFLDLNGWVKFYENWILSIEDSFVHSKDPVQISKSIGAISYEDLEYDYNRAVLSLNRSLNDQGYIEIGYKNMFFKNHSSFGADSVNHFPYLDMRYWLRPQYGVGVNGGVNFGLFDTSDDFIQPRTAVTFFYRLNLDTTLNIRGGGSFMSFDGVTPDYDTYEFTLGVTHALGPSTGIAIGGGYYFQSRLHQAGLHNYDGAIYNLSFWRESASYSMRLEASKGYDEIYFDGENLGFSSCHVVGGSVDYSLTDQIHLNLEISYRDDTFPFAGGWSEKIKERTWNCDCALYFQLNKWIEAGITLSHWKRDANEPDYEYLDNRAMFTIRISKEAVW